MALGGPDTTTRMRVRHRIRVAQGGAIPTGNGTSALAEDAGRLWIVNHRDGTLQRIDPAANTSTALGRLPGDAPERMAYAEGSLWVTGRGTDLLRVDPDTGAVRATI